MTLRSPVIAVASVLFVVAVVALALVHHDPPAPAVTIADPPPLPRIMRRHPHSTTASTQTAAATKDAGLPSEYAFLQTRNPFARGGATAGHNAAAGGPEATLVFRGVAEPGDTFTAFIENMAAKTVLQAAVGDAVGRGHIKSIDIDSLQYDLNGKVRRIEIGQNLNGEAAPAPQPASQPTPQAAPPPPDGAPPPQPPVARHGRRGQPAPQVEVEVQ